MNRYVSGILGLALIGALGWGFVEHRSNAALRGQIAQLEERLRPLEALKAENERLTRLQIDADELARLRKGHAELMKLRAEVSQLRRERQEVVVTPKAAPAPPAPAPVAPTPNPVTPPEPSVTPEENNGYLPRAAWRNVGQGTPEAALQTLQWALANGQVEHMDDLLLFTPGEAPLSDDLQALESILREGTGDPPAEAGAGEVDVLAGAPSVEDVNGSRVLGRRPSGPDQVELTVEQEHADGTRSTVPMIFQRVGNSWKLMPSVVAFPPEELQAPLESP